MNKLTLPSGWNEVPVGMFQELSNLEHTEGMAKIVELISILADKDPEEVKNINASDLDSILSAIQWTGESPINDHKTEVTIDNVTYYLVQLNSLSIGERADLDAYCKDITLLHKFFALLYRPANEVYSVDKMLERSELFVEKLMIEDVYGSLVFFLSIAQRYEMIIQSFTTK